MFELENGKYQDFLKVFVENWPSSNMRIESCAACSHCIDLVIDNLRYSINKTQFVDDLLAFNTNQETD